jgi:hypothetical protein
VAIHEISWNSPRIGARAGRWRASPSGCEAYFGFETSSGRATRSSGSAAPDEILETAQFQSELPRFHCGLRERFCWDRQRQQTETGQQNAGWKGDTVATEPHGRLCAHQKRFQGRANVSVWSGISVPPLPASRRIVIFVFSRGFGVFLTQNFFRD